MSPPVLAICVATFHRNLGLQRLVDSIRGQRAGDFLGGYRLELRVVDNSPQGEAREVADELAARCAFPLRFVHEPAPNIARARNAALGLGPADLVVFVDDDEVAEPDWLERLLEVRHATGADAVLGSVERALPPGAPDWIARGHFFATVEPRGPLSWTETRTGNTLVQGAWFYERGFRFDEAYGRSGGEDCDLFARLAGAGARFQGAPAARVRETVEPHRLSLSFLLRRAWRQGLLVTRIGARVEGERHPLLRFAGRSVQGTGRFVAGLPWAFLGRQELAAAGLARLALAGGGLSAWLRPSLAAPQPYGGAPCASPS